MNASAKILSSLPAEGYILGTSPQRAAVLLVGAAPAGAWYAVQSFLQLVASRGVRAVPAAVRVLDFPDMPVPGLQNIIWGQKVSFLKLRNSFAQLRSKRARGGVWFSWPKSDICTQNPFQSESTSWFFFWGPSENGRGAA